MKSLVISDIDILFNVYILNNILYFMQFSIIDICTTDMIYREIDT